jgi:hypothetical protein
MTTSGEHLPMHLFDHVTVHSDSKLSNRPIEYVAATYGSWKHREKALEVD